MQRLLKHCQVKCDISFICHFSCEGNFTWRFPHLLDPSQGCALRGMPGAIHLTLKLHAGKTCGTLRMADSIEIIRLLLSAC